MTDEAKARKNEYTKRYKKERCFTMCLSFNREAEKELIDYINSLPNKNGYIKALIRRDMAERRKKDGKNISSVFVDDLKGGR